MKSLRELYRIGRGPSSSHTIGPERLAKMFEGEYPDAAAYRVTLFGSLALTGKGHGTDVVLKKTLTKPAEIVFDRDTKQPHPNTMLFCALDEDGNVVAQRTAVSLGGGAVRMEGMPSAEPEDVYPQDSFEEIRSFCEQKGIGLDEYAFEFEGEDIKEYLKGIWRVMQRSVYEGLSATGELPGGLGTRRKARTLFDQAGENEEPETRENRLVCAYAFAVSEQNAAGETIVTAPTCGASGILPAVLKYEQIKYDLDEERVVRALAVAGIIGNIVKQNASISGAECGCQAECGTACSMAAAAAAHIAGLNLDQIEYAAEVAMEHHLGLTCDPVEGLVQIPCIERNAVCAMRAINIASLANFLAGSRQISFDAVVKTMYLTGKDISASYRETSEGGLAKTYETSRLKMKK